MMVFMFLSAPAKPERPTVEGTGVDEVKVTYNFGLGGGYTHEFLVMYRKKCKHTWKCFNNYNDYDNNNRRN